MWPPQGSADAPKGSALRKVVDFLSYAALAQDRTEAMETGGADHRGQIPAASPEPTISLEIEAASVSITVDPDFNALEVEVSDGRGWCFLFALGPDTCRDVAHRMLAALDHLEGRDPVGRQANTPFGTSTSAHERKNATGRRMCAADRSR